MRILGKSVAWLLPIIIVFGGLEVALRMVPQLIPYELLQHFQETPRLAVAERLDLPNRRDVTTVERDDGGPLLRKYLPNQSVTLDFGDEGATKTIVTDSLGFCNPPTSPYDREHIDVIAIGDSLTWCTAVRPDETWPEYLGADSGRTVYNLGFPGVGLYEYLVLLRRYGVQKTPGLVVMNFTEGNDLRDALRYWRFKKGETQESVPDEARGLFNLLARHSYSFNLFVAAWRQWLAPRNAVGSGKNSVVDSRLAAIDKSAMNFRYELDFGGGRVAFNIRNADRDELMHSILVAENLVPDDLFDPAFAEFMRLSRKYGFTPVVTYSPSAHIAYAEYAVYKEPWVGEVVRQYSTWLRRLVAERAARYGFPYLDLTPVLQHEIERQGAERPNKLLYYPGSVHYSIEGNRVIAHAMAEFIKSLPEHQAQRR